MTRTLYTLAFLTPIASAFTWGVHTYGIGSVVRVMLGGAL